MNWRKLKAILAGLGVILSVSAGIAILITVVILFPWQAISAIIMALAYSELFIVAAVFGYLIFLAARAVYRKVMKHE